MLVIAGKEAGTSSEGDSHSGFCSDQPVFRIKWKACLTCWTDYGWDSFEQQWF